jgi:uncharacterized protein (DUF169 family)
MWRIAHPQANCNTLIQHFRVASSMNYETIAGMLTTALDLASPPIALAFADSATGQGAPVEITPAPSACSFWRRAETGVFFAPAEAHFGCPVGAMVMGFDLPKEISDELMGLVGEMEKCGYLAPGESGRIPVSAPSAKGILYGPLAQFSVQPYMVLCWLTPAQAMIWNEAAEDAAWNANKRSSVFGRPACAALPYAAQHDRPVTSFGCIGMRTFTEIAADHLLAAVPGTRLLDFSTALVTMRQTNDAMKSIYMSRKEISAATAGD